MGQDQETNLIETTPVEHKRQLDILLEKLNQRDDIVVAGVYRARPPLEPDWKVEERGEWFHIAIAPKLPIYSLDDLNTFLDDLYKYLSFVNGHSFHNHSWKNEDRIQFGKLSFYETIAKKQIIHRLEEVEPGFLERFGLPEQKIEKEIDIERKVLIILYPHPYLADLVTKYEMTLTSGATNWDTRFTSLHYSISIKDLDKLMNMKEPTSETFELTPDSNT